jgi:hypothetical protein
MMDITNKYFDLSKKLNESFYLLGGFYCGNSQYTEL